MGRWNSTLLIVNGVAFPSPRYGLEIVRSQAVDAGRNANNQVIGQLVGRKLYKLNNLEWVGLSTEKWSQMEKALEPFYVPVTFTDENGERVTVTMYPGDITIKPMHADGNNYTMLESVKVNLVDCGW